MNVFCYGCFPEFLLNALWKRIAQMAPELGMEWHRSLESLETRLRQPGREIACLLVAAEEERTLSDLLHLRPLLQDLSLLILLDSRNPELIRVAHALMPRVILYTDWPPAEIGSVMERCIRRTLRRMELQPPEPEEREQRKTGTD